MYLSSSFLSALSLEFCLKSILSDHAHIKQQICFDRVYLRKF